MEEYMIEIRDWYGFIFGELWKMSKVILLILTSPLWIIPFAVYRQRIECDLCEEKYTVITDDGVKLCEHHKSVHSFFSTLQETMKG